MVSPSDNLKLIGPNNGEATSLALHQKLQELIDNRNFISRALSDSLMKKNSSSTSTSSQTETIKKKKKASSESSGALSNFSSWCVFNQSINASKEVPNVNDDLKRESTFFKQALLATLEVSKKFEKEGISFNPPNESTNPLMIKSNEHMLKIEEKNKETEDMILAKEEAKRQRMLRKFGKQVQQERLTQKYQAKKDAYKEIEELKQSEKLKGRKKKEKKEVEGHDELKKIKNQRDRETLTTQVDDDEFDTNYSSYSMRKRKNKKFDHRSTNNDDGEDFMVDVNNFDDDDNAHRGKTKRSRDEEFGDKKINHKRMKRNEKYGFGGKKKSHMKKNTQESTNDISAFNLKKNKELFKGMSKKTFNKSQGKGKSKSNRPGKSRRQQNRNRQKTQRRY